MSIYICNECGEPKDGDFDNCHEDPTDSTELICESCYEKLYIEIACSECGKTIELPTEIEDGEFADWVCEDCIEEI